MTITTNNSRAKFYVQLFILLTVLLGATVTTSAKGKKAENKAGAVISEVYKPIAVRTYFLESNTQGTYKAFVKAFKADKLQTIAKGYKLENGQFFKAYKRVWKYTQETPNTIKGYKAYTINRY